MRICLALAVATLAVLAAPSTSGATIKLACGDVVTTDVVLTANLSGCSTGLIVGADNITIDLNGRTITGQSILSGSGIEAFDRTGITIKNGRIRGFATGVWLVNTASSTVENLIVKNTDTGIIVGSGSDGLGHSNQVLGNKVADSRLGILMGGPNTLVRANELADLSGIGVWCRDSGRIEANRVRRATNGIELFFCVADVTENDVAENSGAGIMRIRSGGQVARNRANENNYGIVADDSHGLFSENVTNRNQQVGLLINDQIAEHGPFHTVENHTANGNGSFGIFSYVVGVVSLGRNRARGNGEPEQCVNVICG